MRATGKRSTPDNAGPVSTTRTVDAAEVAQFDRLSDEWWNVKGPMRPLHRLNPTRIGYIRDQLIVKFGNAASRSKPLQGLKILDIGCGAGLLAEPLTRLGATVTGIDPGEETIAAAKRHADRQGLVIHYRATTVETLAQEPQRFDAVIASEVIEHVADTAVFVASAIACLAPGGLLLGSTINRTKRAYAFAIFGAEVVMRWLPRGTHTWDKFVTPTEFGDLLEHEGLKITDTAGMIYNPLTDSWRLGKDTAVNYWITAEKPDEGIV